MRIKQSVTNAGTEQESVQYRLWTPLHLELMIKAHSSGMPFVGRREPQGEFVYDLMQEGLIAMEGGNLHATPVGKAFVSMLCCTPVPIAKIVDPRTNEVPGAELAKFFEESSGS